MRVLLQTLFIFLLVTQICFAQWEPDVRLTNNIAALATCYNNAWSLASTGETLHVVWYDERDGGGNQEIYYKRSLNNGITWGTDTRLTFDNALSCFPSIAVSDSCVYVLWVEHRNGNMEIYYKRSTDSGDTWEPDTRLTNDAYSSYNPSVAVSGPHVHVVWMDSRDGNHEVYYKHSSDKGDNWGTDTRLTFFTGDSFSPSVAASDSTVHIVWGDNRYLISEVYYRQSLDNGTTWEPEIRLSENDGFSSANPTVTDSGLNVYVVWEDVRDTNPEIYYKHSPDNGTSWETDTRLTNHSSNKNSPSVAVSGTNIHIIWADSRDGNAEIYYKCSVDGGTSWQSDTRLTNFDGSSQYPSIALSGTVVHIVWYDDRDANTEIYYKRNPTGNPTGIININSETLAEFKLYQNYPNPFNPSTKISWQAPVGSHQVLKVFDILGNEVATLVDEYKEAGNYEVDFNAASLSSGVYFYRLNTGDYVKTMKMVLLK